MFNPGINGIVRTVLISSFAIALLVGAGGAYVLLHARAVERTAAEAGRLLSAATAVRSYTDANVAPLLKTGDKFHAETVPAFAAQMVYKEIQREYPGYAYREPALRPTNPGDLATPIEVELINRFRESPELKELAGVRNTDNGRVYFLARPIRAAESCLVCHDTPQRAPATMVARYGPNNGFGWKANEVVALQSLTIPAAAELRETGEIALILAGGLLIVFGAAYFVLTAALETLVTRPVRTLARSAEAASLGNKDSTPLPASGASEIRTLASAIERLRISVVKSTKALERLVDRPPSGGG